jgi:hypothetical protein
MLLKTGVRDARKITKKETGVHEKEPGSGVWWVRFKSNGVTRREKIGWRGDAIAAIRIGRLRSSVERSCRRR